MIYTDGLHLVADTLKELHTFAQFIGLKRHFFHGLRKGHPYYDITSNYIKSKAILKGAKSVGFHKLLTLSKNTTVLPTPYHNYTAKEVRAHKDHERRMGFKWLRS